jgi:hypothetical protein
MFKFWGILISAQNKYNDDRAGAPITSAFAWPLYYSFFCSLAGLSSILSEESFRLDQKNKVTTESGLIACI